MFFLRIIFVIIFMIEKSGFSQTKNISIVPYPNDVIQLDGAFSITPFTKIIIQQRKNKTTEELNWVAQYLDTHLFASDTSKKYNNIQSKLMRPQRIVLSLKNYFREIGSEGYKLSVFPDVIIISGNTPQGVFYGVQTLLQLAKPIQIAGQQLYYQVEGISITDFPKFAWRGLHLDVSRHFFDVEFIKKYIDLLAIHKLNMFHWHLVDDQGWRIEINKYPKLTKIGAWRNDETNLYSNADSSNISKKNLIKYGGFYTQEAISEVVNYAKKRFVKIVPEIEMPGHVQSALAAYPNLSCTKNKVNVASNGISDFSEPFCPSDSSFKFLEDVLAEVFKLFPDEYVHIGGNDVNLTYWKSSNFVKNLMLQRGFSTYNEVQGYFTKRIERLLTINGKKLIGWDEIIEHNLPSTSVIMCSRNEKYAIKAINYNHFVVMSPKSHLCFDALNEEDKKYPNLPIIDLEKVYNYNPIPNGLTTEESQRILGLQANVWTEFIQTPERAEKMIIPRVCALSEVAWKNPAQKDFERFKNNLPKFLYYLTKNGFNGFIAIPKIQNDQTVFTDKFEIALFKDSLDEVLIKYTLDGSDPLVDGKKYQKPVEIYSNTIFKAVSITNYGNSEVALYTFEKQNFKSASQFITTNLGLNYTYYEGKFTKLEQLDTAKSIATRIISQIKIPSYVPKDFWAAVFDGYLAIPDDGIYTFYLTADDGVSLYIDNELIIENDGIHIAVDKQHTLALKKGLHKIKCKYFENNGNESLTFSWKSDRFAKQTVLPSYFFRE